MFNPPSHKMSLRDFLLLELVLAEAGEEYVTYNQP